MKIRIRGRTQARIDEAIAFSTQEGEEIFAEMLEELLEIDDVEKIHKKIELWLGREETE